MAVKAESAVRATRRVLADLPEPSLLERAQAGEAMAFEEIMRRNNRRLFRIALAVSKNEAEAEEVVQEAYLKAFSSLAGFGGRSSLSTWLSRIAVNEALDRQRRARPTVNLSVIAGGKEDHLAPQDEGPWPKAPESPESLAARGELGGLAEKAIEALPQAFRVVFVLRAVEGYSVAETAEVLEIAPITVKTRFFRARHRLKAALQQEMEGAFAEAYPFAGARCDRIVEAVLTRLHDG